MKPIKKSFLYNIIHTLATKFGLIFGSFLISIITARLIGPEGKGIITAVFAVPSLIISFADLGIKQSATYFIARSKYSTNEVINSIIVIWIFTSILGLTIVLLYFSFGLSNEYSWYILLIALSTVPINLLYNYSKGVLQGKELIHYLNNSSIVGVVGNFLFVVILVWLLDLNVLGTAIAQSIGILLSLLYSLYFIKHISPFQYQLVPGLPKQLFTRGIIYSLTLFILQLNYRVDIVMLEQYTSSHDIGIYSIGVSIAEILWLIPSSIGLVLFSRSANTSSSTDAITRSVKLYRITAPLMLIITALFFAFAPFLVSLVYGKDFLDSSSVIRLLLPGVLSMVAFKILHSDMAGRGKPLFAFNVFLTSLIVNILLNFILIPKSGIHGAALASSISYLLGSVLYVIKYANTTKTQFKSLIFQRKDFDELKKSLQHLYRQR